ncbi:hypothetical protein ACLOJK_037220, partial [Asimina triloba]
MSLEDVMVSFVQETNARFKKIDSRLDNIETHYSNMGATMKNLEVQIGQLATTINAQQRRNARPSHLGVEEKLKGHHQKKPTPPLQLKNNGQNKNKVEEEDDTPRETDMPPAISFPDNPPILSTPLPYPKYASEQMSNYVKFLKDIISKKR